MYRNTGIGFRAAAAAFAAFAAFAVVASGQAAADSLEVSPTRLSLDTHRAGVLNVVNRGDEPITAQVEAFDWRQEGGTDRLDPSQTLQVSPPIVRLAPGQKQIVRVRVTSNVESGSEQAFRLVASELPNPTSKRAGTVSVLLQFKIPVFVGATVRTPRRLIWTANPAGNDLALRVSNGGVSHVKLTGLHVLSSDGQNLTIEPESFFYVLAGGTREWTISEAGVTPGTQLRIEGKDESDGTRINDAVIAGR